MICVPVTSLGMRSGVNCTRLKLRCMAWASELMSSVLARPGTPSSNAWPRAKIATSTCSITSCWPTMTPESSLQICSYAALQRATAATSSELALDCSSFMTFLSGYRNWVFGSAGHVLEVFLNPLVVSGRWAQA